MGATAGLASSLGPAGWVSPLPSSSRSAPCPLDGIYYGDGRFNTVSESGTATLKARPRVRPLLTFLPLVSTALL